MIAKMMMFCLLLSGALLSCSDAANESSSTPKLITKTTVKIWPRGIVPYKISDSMPYARVKKIMKAVQQVTDKTVVTLIPLEEASNYGVDEEHYINFVTDEKHCSSPIGRERYTYNQVKLADWCEVGTIMHEIFHSLGIMHEQVHPDSGLIIRESRVEEGMEGNFRSANPYKLTAYDRQSIMHYHSHGFTICNKLDDPKWDNLAAFKLPDISCKNDNWRNLTASNNNGIDCYRECATILDSNGNTFISNQDHLTDMDILGIAELYKDEVSSKPVPPTGPTGPTIPSKPQLPLSPVSLHAKFNDGVVHASGWTRVGSGFEIYQQAQVEGDADRYYLLKSSSRENAYKIVSKKYNTCIVANRHHRATWNHLYNVYHRNCDGQNDNYWYISEKEAGYFEFRSLEMNLCIHHSFGKVLTTHQQRWQIYLDPCDGNDQNLMKLVP